MIAPDVTTNRAEQKTPSVARLSACGVCLGDMIELITPEGIDVICIECGHRSPAPATNSPIATATR